MKKYLKQHWLEMFFAFILVAIAAAGISVLFGYCFSTNDDAMLRNIVSGNYTGTPDAHLVYIMYPLGFVWKCLYSVLPEIPWYDCFMVGMHYLCWFMILFRLGQLFEKRISKIVAVTVGMAGCIIVDLPYLVMHQYTVLAALLATVAIFWLATSAKKKGRLYWADRIVCIVFLTLCLWLRNQVFLMALPIGLVLLILELTATEEEGEKTSPHMKRIGLFLAVVFAIMLVSFGIEKIAYSSEEWQDFEVYNEARTDVYDFYGVPGFVQYEEQYEQMGIDSADWIVLDHYDGGFMAELDSSLMVQVAQLSKQSWKDIQQTYNVFLQNLYSVCKTILYNEIQPIGCILMVLYVSALWSTYKNKQKNVALCITGMLLFQAVFVGYFIWKQRFPEHVSYGFYLMQAMCLAAILLKNKVRTERDIKTEKFWLVLGAVLCAVVVAGMGIYRIRTTKTQFDNVQARANDWKYVNEYFSQNENARYCIVTKSFVFATEEMFGANDVESDNMIRTGTWVQNSPLQREQENAINVTNLAQQVAGAEEFYVVQAAENDLDWLNSFWQGNGYNVSAEVEDTIQTPGGRMFHVIKMQ